VFRDRQVRVLHVHTLSVYALSWI